MVIASDDRDARQMISALQAVSFRRLAGYAVTDLDAWREAGLPTVQARAWDLDRLVAGLRDDTVELVDVREPGEWALGHLSG